MSKRNNIRKILLITCSCLLAACADNLMFNEAPQHLTAEILTTDTTIPAGDSVYFQAIINPQYYEKDFYWTISPSQTPERRIYFTRTFDEPGDYEVILYVIDYFNDTLRVGPITISVTD